MATPVDKSELNRLLTLLEYQILDTPSEFEYDEIVKLASAICEVPIAMVSLIDEHRQWFKAKIGIDFNESARETSFCTHAINQGDIFIVKDMTKDSRFALHPAVTGKLNVKFYAGAPLVTPSGHALGTLCVIDHQSRDLTPVQLEALKILSRQVVSQLELRKSQRLLKESFDSYQTLSQKLQAQERVMTQNIKMAALGEMAAGAAHEINNPLAIIDGRANQILNAFEKVPLDIEKIKKYTNGISDTVDRIASIVKGLLSFSGTAQELEKQNSNLKNIVDDVIHGISERAAKEHVLIDNKIDTDFFVHFSITQITQAILNIAFNSLDAILDSKEKWLRFEVEKSGDTLLLKISDSGNGIPVEIRDKIMQPFFTTKPVGHGIGLGLSIAKGLAESEGAALYLDPKALNTCFVLGFKQSLSHS